MRIRVPVTGNSVMTEETRILYQRTLREARTAARLNHPAVVTIFDVVEADGSPWIVMELVEARSLDQVLTEDGPLPPHQAADLGMRVLGALACAHAAGILHRDVKPSNVLLGPDRRAVLTDFGIATLEGDSGLTQAGMVMGTPGFTAPERIRGDLATPASDLWSLGATLYAAVEGRGPFDNRGNSIAILAAIANEEAPRPRSAGPLCHVIEALLHRNPQARPDAAAAGRLLAAAGARISTGTRRPATRRQGAGAGAPLLAAPPDLAAAGPKTQVPADGVSRPEAPWPDGRVGRCPVAGGPRRLKVTAVRGCTVGKQPGTAARRAAPAGPQAAGPRGPQSRAPDPGRRTTGGRTTGGGPGGRTTGRAARRARPGIPARARRRTGDDAPARPPPSAAPSRRSGHRGRGHPGRGDPGPREQWHRRPGRGAGLAGRDGEPAGSPATFTMTVPAGWHTSQQGAGTDFTSPARGRSILVTPAAAGGATVSAQLRRQLARGLRQGRFPGYKPVGGRPFTFQGGAGVARQFTWQPGRGGRMESLDIAFRLTTPAGRQAYLVRESAPAAAWVAAQPAFRRALSTFRAGS